MVYQEPFAVFVPVGMFSHDGKQREKKVGKRLFALNAVVRAFSFVIFSGGFPAPSLVLPVFRRQGLSALK